MKLLNPTSISLVTDWWEYLSSVWHGTFGAFVSFLPDRVSFQKDKQRAWETASFRIKSCACSIPSCCTALEKRHYVLKLEEHPVWNYLSYYFSGVRSLAPSAFAAFMIKVSAWRRCENYSKHLVLFCTSIIKPFVSVLLTCYVSTYSFWL